MTKVLIALALSPFSGALRASVFAKGWEWFVADGFGLPHLSLLQAWGISFLISFLVWLPHGDEDSDPLLAFFASVLLSVFTFIALLILVQFR